MLGEEPHRAEHAIVGNPPFAGKNTMARANAAGYPDWLKTIHQDSHGNADLVSMDVEVGWPSAFAGVAG